MGTLVKHCQLLGIEDLDDPILSLKGGIQRKDLELVKLFFDRLEVPSQVLKLGFDPDSDGLFGRILILGYFQIAFSGLLPIGSRLLAIRLFGMKVVDDRFSDLSRGV